MPVDHLCRNTFNRSRRSINSSFDVETRCEQNAVAVHMQKYLREVQHHQCIYSLHLPLLMEESELISEYGLHRAHLKQAQLLHFTGLLQCATDNCCNVQDLTTCNISSGASSLHCQLIRIAEHYCVWHSC